MKYLLLFVLLGAILITAGCTGADSTDPSSLKTPKKIILPNQTFRLGDTVTNDKVRITVNSVQYGHRRDFFEKNLIFIRSISHLLIMIQLRLRIFHQFHPLVSRMLMGLNIKKKGIPLSKNNYPPMERFKYYLEKHVEGIFFLKSQSHQGIFY